MVDLRAGIADGNLVDHVPTLGKLTEPPTAHELTVRSPVRCPRIRTEPQETRESRPDGLGGAEIVGATTQQRVAEPIARPPLVLIDSHTGVVGTSALIPEHAEG